jgi:hypothetical protein
MADRSDWAGTRQDTGPVIPLGSRDGKAGQPFYLAPISKIKLARDLDLILGAMGMPSKAAAKHATRHVEDCH